MSSEADPSELGGGDAGMCVFGGVWKGRSVGEMYPRETSTLIFSGSSSIGVIGGGGVTGGGGDVSGPTRRGDDAAGAADDMGLGRLVRCNRRELGLWDDSTERGETPGAVSSKMLPRSLPYAGGGARVPTLGARPHFFTLASMKTKPTCPRLTCMLQGPSAPIVGKRL